MDCSQIPYAREQGISRREKYCRACIREHSPLIYKQAVDRRANVYIGTARGHCPRRPARPLMTRSRHCGGPAFIHVVSMAA